MSDYRCGEYTMLGVRRASGAPRVVHLPCGRWDCPHCGPRHRDELLAHLHRLAERAGSEARWWYVVGRTPRHDASIARRSSGVDHVRVLREIAGRPILMHPVARGRRPRLRPPVYDSATWIASTVPKTPPSGRIVAPATAVELLGRGALHRDRLSGIPGKQAGVTRVTWSRGWRPPKPRPAYERIAVTRDEALVRRALADAADQAERLTGYRPEEGVDLPVRGPLDPTSWAAMVSARWEAVYSAERKRAPRT